jgi:branched-chain amino acid transport system permease protein
VPRPCSFALIGAPQLFMSRTYIGRAILAVSQDSLALRLMSINPSRVKLTPSRSRWRRRQSPARC